MNRTVTTLAVVAAMSALAACDRSNSAAQVVRETAAGEQAENSAAKVQQKADARIASARTDEHRDLAHAGAVGGNNGADTQVEDGYKVARARCEGLSGTTQQSCKDQAVAGYEVAKARAEQARAGADAKP